MVVDTTVVAVDIVVKVVEVDSSALVVVGAGVVEKIVAPKGKLFFYINSRFHDQMQLRT